MKKTVPYRIDEPHSELPRPHRLRSLRGVRMLATGSYVPENIVTNEQLEETLGFDAKWIVQRTGIRQRRFAAPSEATSDLCCAAAKQAIERAEIDPDEIDLVIVGTFTPDMAFPSTACLVQDRLGLNAAAMDLQAACAGFMYALITGAQYVATGCSKRALVIGGDCNSRIINPKDQRTYPLFGDGAGAVLLAPGASNQGLISYTLGADGSGGDLLNRPSGGSRLPPAAQHLVDGLQYLQMDGRAVFKWAVRILTDTIETVLADTNLDVEGISLFVPHQANIRILKAATDVLHIPTDRIFNNLDLYGNTSAGSIPLALDQASRSKGIKPGDTVLFSGFGAGLTWGTALWRW